MYVFFALHADKCWHLKICNDIFSGEILQCTGANQSIELTGEFRWYDASILGSKLHCKIIYFIVFHFMDLLGCGPINSFAIHLRARTLGPPEVLNIRNSQNNRCDSSH